MISLFKKYFGLFKYVVSGGSAACVNLGVLYLLTEYGKLHYLQSAVISFICAFFVSFLLQKFWTFRDARKEVIHWQMMGFLGSSLVNLFLNTTIIFILVEYFHVWYLIAAFIAGILLAVASFFVYRHVIFVEHKEGSRIHRLLLFLRKNLFKIGAIAVLALAAFLSTYHLTESPPTWLDEGIITQTALNVLEHGPHASLQTAPDTFVSAGYVSTAYTVTYPVALSLKLFGTGLLQARAVMVIFILGFLIAAYALMRREGGALLSLGSLALLSTFAPLYGNGKNVLGEVPGLFYLAVSLYLIKKIESRKAHWLEYATAGLFLGLAVATKPIFLLLLPVLAVVLFYSLTLFSARTFICTLVGFLLPIGWWFFSQFRGEPLSYMLGIYANPHGNNLAQSLAHNSLAFVTQLQPLYALLLLLVWFASAVLRFRRKGAVSRAECIALGFAALVYLAYLRGAEYYRYFFLGEALALAYAPLALSALWPKKIAARWIMIAVALFAALQLYQCFFDSWVAEHYSSTRSRDLQSLAAQTEGKSVLIYQAPEAVVFLPRSASFYQYLNITQVITLGSENVLKVGSGAFDEILLPTEQVSSLDLSRYIEKTEADRYSLWVRK